MIGLGKFNNKVLISSQSLNWNIAMRVVSFHLRSQAISWSFSTYVEGQCERCCSNQSFTLAIRAWSLCQNVLLNSSRNWSRIVKSEELFSKSDENYNNAVPVSKVTMNQSCISSIEYLWAWRQKTSQIWLTKSQSLVQSPSNLFSKLTPSSFSACGYGTRLGTGA